jgi:hypothetical protein
MITEADILKMKDRLHACLRDHAEQALKAGEVTAYGAYMHSADFVLAEPIFRRYPVANDTTEPDGDPVGTKTEESERAVDVSGIPV